MNSEGMPGKGVNAGRAGSRWIVAERGVPEIMDDNLLKF